MKGVAAQSGQMADAQPHVSFHWCGGPKHVCIAQAGAADVSSFEGYRKSVKCKTPGLLTRFCENLLQTTLHFAHPAADLVIPVVTATDISVLLSYTVWTISVWRCFPVTPTFTVTIKDDSKTYVMDMVQIFPTASEMIISLQEQKTSEMWA